MEAKSQLIGKDSEAVKIEGKPRTEDKMFGWLLSLNEHEFEQTPGDSEAQETSVLSPTGLQNVRLSD